jgi:hypothetical protein
VSKSLARDFAGSAFFQSTTGGYMHAFLRRKRQWEYWHEQQVLDLQKFLFATIHNLLVWAITLTSLLLYLFYKTVGWLKKAMVALMVLAFYSPRPVLKISPGEHRELYDLPAPVPIFKR